MGIFSRFRNIFTKDTEKRSGSYSSTDPNAWLWSKIGWTDSGSTVVNLNTALSQSPFYTGVKIIAETDGVLPFQLHKRKKDGSSELAINHPLFNMVHSEPNEIQTSSVFTQAESANVAANGAAYSKIDFDNDGMPIAYNLLSYNHITPFRKGKKIYYDYNFPGDGINPPVKTVYFSWEILHLMNFSFDGINGLNFVNVQKEMLKRGISAQNYGNNYFDNGTHSGGQITTDKRPPDGKLGEYTRGVIDNFKKQFSGMKKTGDPVVMWDGYQFKKEGDNLQDSMLLGVLSMTVQDVSRGLRIPIELLDSSNRSQATKQEEIMLQLRNARLPYLRQRQEEYNRKLLPKHMKGEYFFKHNIKGLLQADTEAQARLLETMYKLQMISPNDGLKILDMPPRPGGDEYGLPFASNIKTEPKKVEKKSLNGVLN